MDLDLTKTRRAYKTGQAKLHNLMRMMKKAGHAPKFTMEELVEEHTVPVEGSVFVLEGAYVVFRSRCRFLWDTPAIAVAENYDFEAWAVHRMYQGVIPMHTSESKHFFVTRNDEIIHDDEESAYSIIRAEKRFKIFGEVTIMMDQQYSFTETKDVGLYLPEDRASAVDDIAERLVRTQVVYDAKPITKDQVLEFIEPLVK